MKSVLAHARARTPWIRFPQPHRSATTPLLPQRSFHVQTNRAAARHERYSEAEDDTILRLRRSGVSWDEIARQVPGRSVHSVKLHFYHALSARAGGDGLVRPAKLDLTEDDLDRLELLRRRGRGWREIAALYPGVSAHQLCDWFCRHTRARAAEGPARVSDDVVIAAAPRTRPYTPAEDEELFRCRDGLGLPWIEIARRIPGRSPNSVLSRYFRLVPVGRRTNVIPAGTAWSPSAREALRLRDEGMAWPDIAGRLAIPPDGPRRAEKDGAGDRKSKDLRRYAPWTKEEDSILLGLRKEGDVAEGAVAGVLGRSVQSVLRRLRHLTTL